MSKQSHPNERLAMKTLFRNKKIVIKKSDKNSAVVLLDRDIYIQMGMKHLNDQIHYEQLKESHTSEIKKRIECIINELHKTSHIDDTTFKYLKDTKTTRLGRLYFLPKIHKIGDKDRQELKINQDHFKNINIPVRPIVSLCNSPIEKIGHFIDYFIQPIVSQLWTYTKDSTAFINKLEKITAPHNVLLSSFDITSMYSNMYHDELIEAVDRAWPKITSYKFDVPLPPKAKFLSLLKIVLENNEFEFNGQIYRQLVGLAMGAKMSPSLSDLRMFEIISEILQQFSHSENI